MSYREDRESAALDQATLRERINPGWREQLRSHREQLGIGPETAGMGAREIIKRAVSLNLSAEAKRFKYQLQPRRKKVVYIK